jgi:dTDP-4-dehydrorhamnose 3,5-epimerase
MPFSFRSLSIPEVILVEPRAFSDDRGYFLESFKSSDFSLNHIPSYFVQDNLSFSKQNVIRGMHFQKKPKEQGKLVSVVKGRVLDVAVDLREESPTFMKWIAVELNDEKHEMLYIPEGFAHGFLSLTEEVYLVYKCTKEFDLKCDSGVRWDDPDIGIEWPVDKPVVSEKDKRLPYFKQLNM